MNSPELNSTNPNVTQTTIPALVPDSTALAAVAVQLPCRFLRCKEMYYGGSEDDADAGGVYWCERTQEAFGPDGDSCSRKQCCTQRSCYVI